MALPDIHETRGPGDIPKWATRPLEDGRAFVRFKDDAFAALLDWSASSQAPADVRELLARPWDHRRSGRELRIALDEVAAFEALFAGASGPWYRRMAAILRTVLTHHGHAAESSVASEGGGAYAVSADDARLVDVMVRDVPGRVVDVLDDRARERGTSRAEYLRALLDRHARAPERPVTRGDLDQLTASLADVRAPDFEDGAWS